MIFSLWNKNGAQNSQPIFDAFARSVVDSGHDVVYNSDHSDVDVIWSVLWHGRMAANKTIWDRNQDQSRPTVVLEVGGISRGTTWKVGLNGINRDAYFGPVVSDSNRAQRLGLTTQPWRKDGEYILVCGQHDKSLQWRDMPRMSNWFLQTYDTIRKHTDRPIIFRPHPRCRLEHIERGLRYVIRQEPKHIEGSYDDFDMGFDNVFCTVSWSSNPGIYSVINGVPAFVGPSSLAYPVAGHDLNLIEYPQTPDRTRWLNDYAWTEYTVDEIAAGLPLQRLFSDLRNL